MKDPTAAEGKDDSPIFSIFSEMNEGLGPNPVIESIMNAPRNIR
jgi:hypothetical protein